MVIQALQKVFRKPAYTIIVVCVSMSVFVFILWLPNIRLIASVISSPDIPLANKVGLPISLLGSIATNFTWLSASYTLALAILFGVYVAMLAYFIKRRVREAKQSGIATGFLGIWSGILGVGCASCGSFLFVSLVGASGALAFLPLGGGEFGIIGVALLMIAVYSTAKQIENPAVCKITN